VLQAFQTVNMPSLGTINAPTEMTLEPTTSSDPTVTLVSDMSLGSSFSIIGYNSHVNTLTLGGYNLIANGITIGALGQIVATSSDITDSGDWDSSAGYFVQGSGILYMTGGRSGHTLAAWSAAASGSLTFSVPDLVNGTTYVLFIDGDREYSLIADGSGVVQFTYSGPWSEHDFKVIWTSIPENIYPLVNMVLIFFALAIAMSAIGFALKAKDKGASKNEFIEMVVFVLISVIMMGILVVVLGSI
jgi:hypothetical protein